MVPSKWGFGQIQRIKNLNRDYLKADTRETNAWLRLWNEWNPDFFIDCHVTDGADFRYNITYEFAHHAEITNELSEWMRKYFEGRVVPKVESNGNLLSRYLQLADRGESDKRDIYVYCDAKVCDWVHSLEKSQRTFD